MKIFEDLPAGKYRPDCVMGSELPEDMYNQLYGIFGKDFPEDLTQALTPDRVLISKGDYVDVSVLWFWKSSLRRYDINGKLLLSCETDDVSETAGSPPGTPGFYGCILGAYDFFLKPHADNVMENRRERLREKLDKFMDAVFGGQV